jgi:hypothetical protein
MGLADCACAISTILLGSRPLGVEETGRLVEDSIPAARAATTDVRAVLGPLVSLATELKVAVIGIMHFNKKLDVTNVLLRISDS